MSRDVQFDENAVCDECGVLGAFDFMGDFVCPKCLSENYHAAQHSVQADVCPECHCIDGHLTGCSIYLAMFPITANAAKNDR